MAIVANTFQTYQAIGRRENLADTIYNISPSDVPFMSMIGRSKATNTLAEWQTDALAAAAANAHIEGDEYAFTAVTPTVRLGNYTQISRKTVIVSGTQQAGIQRWHTSWPKIPRPSRGTWKLHLQAK